MYPKNINLKREINEKKMNQNLSLKMILLKISFKINNLRKKKQFSN